MPLKTLSISDTAVASILDQLSILEQRTLLVLERRSLELELPALQLLGSRVNDVNNIVVGINSDGVAVADKTNGTALLGFRSDVTDQETVAAAGEATISDEGNVVAETVAHDGGAGLEHLRHTGATLGTLVADDDDGLLALLESAGLEGFDEEVLGVEAAGLAGEDGTLLAGDLADGALGGEAAAEDLDVAGGLDGVGDGADDVLVGGEVGDEFCVLLEGLAGDGHAGAVEHALLEQVLDQAGGAADVVEVLEDVLAGRLEVGEERCAVGNGLEVVDGESDADRVGNGDQVEDGVGAATSDVHEDHGVLKSLASDDVGRSDVLLQQVLDGATGGQALHHLRLALGGVGRRTGKRHSHDLNHTGQSVGGVHATAGTAAGARVSNNIEALLLGDLARDELSVSLERRDNVQLGVLGLLAATSRDRTTVNHQTRPVHASHSHDNTGHVLVATRNADVRIVPLTTHDRLNRVGNKITALQRVAHALGTHADTVTYTNGVELHAVETGALHTLLDLVVQLHQVHVAGVSRVPDTADADLGLVQVAVLHAGGVQHGLRRALGLGLCDVAGDLVEVFGIFGDGAGSLEAGGGRECSPGQDVSCVPSCITPNALSER
jgi:hypothetical protein